MSDILNKQDFEFFLKMLDFVYTPVIDETLQYFRDQYKKRPHKYVGDKEFFDLFKRALLTGVTIIEASTICKKVIDREMFVLDRHYSIGLPYEPLFFLVPL